MPQPLTKSEAISLCFSGGMPCLAVFLYSEYMRSVEDTTGQLPGAAVTCISLYMLSFVPQVFFILCGPGQGSSDNTICSIDMKSIMRIMSLFNMIGMVIMCIDTVGCFNTKSDDAMYTKASCAQCYDEGTHNKLYTRSMMSYAFLCLVYLIKKNGPDCLERMTSSGRGLFARSNPNDGYSDEEEAATRPSDTLDSTSGNDSDEEYGASRHGSYSSMLSTSGSESD